MNSREKTLVRLRKIRRLESKPNKTKKDEQEIEQYVNNTLAGTGENNYKIGGKR